MQSRSAPKHPQKRAFAQHGRIRRALLFLLGVMVLSVGLYGLAGSYGGPRLVDQWLAQYRAAAPGRVVSRETVRFNPFTLVAEIVAFETHDEAAGAALAADSIAVDFSAQSLIELRPVVGSMVIERPRITFASVADLRAAGRRIRDAALYGERVDHLELRRGTLTAGRGSDRSVEFARFDLSLAGFDRRSGTAGRFDLDAVTTAEASIASDGSLAANLERADGQLRLSAIELGAVAARLGGIFRAVEPRGRIDLSADFSATSLLNAPTLELTNANLDLSELSLTPTSGFAVTADRLAAAANLVLAAAEDGIDVSGRVQTDAAQVSVRDARVMPPQSFTFDDAAVLLTADARNDGLSLSLEGPLNGAGEATLTVRVPPGAAPEHRVSIEAARLPMTMLSTYAVDALGRRLAAGDADLSLDYSLNGSRVDGSLRIVARELAFAAQTGDPTNVGSPSLELAAALLENSDHIIEIAVPFASYAGTVRDAATAALRARIGTLTAAPFETLAPFTDGARDPVNAVPFLPGDAALNDRALASMMRLAAALEARPRLGLRVHGGYDPTADRDALARQQIELHVQLATADPTGPARPRPLDFSSERAQDVLDEFAGERLPAERVEELAQRFDCEDAFVAACERAYYELVFDALVENETITPAALNRLGRFRAQSVVEALRQRGIAEERIEVVADRDIVETPFGVGLPVELTAAGVEP